MECIWSFVAWTSVRASICYFNWLSNYLIWPVRNLVINYCYWHALEERWRTNIEWSIACSWEESNSKKGITKQRYLGITRTDFDKSSRVKENKERPDVGKISKLDTNRAKATSRNSLKKKGLCKSASPTLQYILKPYDCRIFPAWLLSRYFHVFERLYLPQTIRRA